MDVSKLPRFSKTQTPQSPPGEPDPTPATPTPAEDIRSLPPSQQLSGRGPEAWISIGVGLIFLLVFPHFTQWWTHVVFHTATPSFLPITDSNTGAEVPYPKSIFFMSDLCIALFAYALVIEGIALLLARGPALVMLAFVVAVASVLLNAYYLIASYNESGLSIVSAIAVVFGGYMAWYQWHLLTDLIGSRRQGARAK